MFRKTMIGVSLGAATFAAMAVDAWAQRRVTGFTITCQNDTGRCTYREHSTVVQNMRWHDGVYVEGDGDLGRFTVASEQQCERLCRDDNSCVMAEFYYGRETRRPACNLFSRIKTLKWNSSGDATVGVWR